MMNPKDPPFPDPLPRSTRRAWLRGAASAAAVPVILDAASPAARAAGGGAELLRAGFSQDGNRIRLQCAGLSRPIKLVFAADTHLSRDDARGDAYREFSKRMAGGYQRTKHFQSGGETHPEACFEETLEVVRREKADLLVLGGDIFSFPSEAAIEWVTARLGTLEVPWLYTAGNHDWHYEGMEGSSAALRSKWIAERLLPLYGGRDPMNALFEIAGIKILLIDNSTCEVSPGQLEFFRREAASGNPLILCVHIPLYAPGRPVGFGCGHPEWGAATDKNHRIERRPIWPERHSEVTMDFHREVFASPHLLGIFAGHIHRLSTDVFHGVPQVVAAANATGAHLVVEVV